MKLSEYVLRLVATGQLTKEAGANAFTFQKKAVQHPNAPVVAPPAPSPGMDALKSLGVQLAAIKGLELAGKGLSAGMDYFNAPNKDMVFQDLMATHPGLKGKDPVRAKANLDYILDEMPHLADHPLILGDHVANMTALGATDPMTLKTIAEIGKARNDLNKNDKSWIPESVLTEAGNKAKEVYEQGKAPPPTPPVSDFDRIRGEVDKQYGFRNEVAPIEKQIEESVMADKNEYLDKVRESPPMSQYEAGLHDRDIARIEEPRKVLQRHIEAGPGGGQGPKDVGSKDKSKDKPKDKSKGKGK